MWEGIAAGLAVLFVARVGSMIWKRAMGPIRHLGLEMASWSDDDKKMLKNAGYDLSKLEWVINYKVAEERAAGHIPVRKGCWWFKREVHLPRKSGHAVLMQKPDSNAPQSGKQVRR